MESLSVDHVKKVSGEVHTYDSFARAFMQSSLRTAAELIAKKQSLSSDGGKVTFNTEVSVERSGPCVWVCVPGAGCFKICIHDI
jgi:hypothetical protein